MSNAAIALDTLTHRYGGALALDGVSLTLPRAASIAFIGPDGVGKSTLLSIVAGVRRIQGGAVQVLGSDMRQPAARHALSSRIAFMPQGLGHNLYPTMSVQENLEFFARLYSLPATERRQRMQRLLRATALAPFADRPAGKLSGGMKQKLGLCCALVHEPDLLILDEPTTGVDPLSRRQFWALVDALRAERPHMTVIVSTAYMDEAERFEHLVAMDAGRVLATGSAQELKARTGCSTLEDAYIALLPPEKRPAGGTLHIPPWVDTDAAPVIEAEHLTRRFGRFVAVDDVSFRIQRGEIFGFLGSNGCGKSTTMKMLTGLLDISSGSAKLLGKPIRAGDMATRRRVGYMSQAFSLYEELSVQRNLRLHARLYGLDAARAARAVEAALDGFELRAHANALPASLPLGIRQRLQLAAACLHEPEILILDEPTSGVDPAARDMFWRHLARLSREQGVTIFVSTHFMNEAARCDRISLMHHGRVLVAGKPQTLADERGAGDLEQAFIAWLEDAEGDTPQENTSSPAYVAGDQSIPNKTTTNTNNTHQNNAPSPAPYAGDRHIPNKQHWLALVWAFARREALELARDRLRLAFALLGPIALLLIAAFSISFDINRVHFAVIDHDASATSRSFIEPFQGARIFEQVPGPRSREEGEDWLRDGRIKLLIDVPPGFGRELAAGRKAEAAFIIDGAIPFTAASVRGYASMMAAQWAAGLMQQRAALSPALLDTARLMPVTVRARYVYNQEFRSIDAITPGIIMLAMIMIPTMLTALGVVREKEIGSIINLYASPASVGQYLLGKQLPYAALASASFVTLVLAAITIVGVPLRGSALALLAGGVLFALTATALGLFVSAVVRSQVAAIAACALICLIPSANFAGLLYPISTLKGVSAAIGYGFPSSWFQLISLGAFTKGLGAASFVQPYLVLTGMALFCMTLARLLLRRQL